MRDPSSSNESRAHIKQHYAVQMTIIDATADDTSCVHSRRRSSMHGWEQLRSGCNAIAEMPSATIFTNIGASSMENVYIQPNDRKSSKVSLLQDHIVPIISTKCEEEDGDEPKYDKTALNAGGIGDCAQSPTTPLQYNMQSRLNNYYSIQPSANADYDLYEVISIQLPHSPGRSPYSRSKSLHDKYTCHIYVNTPEVLL
jgi:hypothetical protein